MLLGPGRHYCVAFCEALRVIVECGGKICREVYQRGGRRLRRRSDGGQWSNKVKREKREVRDRIKERQAREIREMRGSAKSSINGKGAGRKTENVRVKRVMDGR